MRSINSRQFGLEYQSNGTNRIEINSYEVGQSFSLSLAARF
jgi:hypothetical protein